MNLMMLLEMAASGLGDRTAIGSRTSGGITYQELFDQAHATARRLRNADVDAAVLCDESSHAVPIKLFGAVLVIEIANDDDGDRSGHRAGPAHHGGAQRLAFARPEPLAHGAR